MAMAENISKFQSKEECLKVAGYLEGSADFYARMIEADGGLADKQAAWMVNHLREDAKMFRELADAL